MTVHVQVRTALEGLAGDRVFPLVADENTPVPYIVFQIVGGDPQEFLSGEKPAKKKRRVQVNVWSKSTLEAGQIAEQAEDALRAVVELQTEVLTVPADTFDETTRYRGTMQEFYLFC
jgi:uncharacterized protein YcbX